MNRTRIPSEWNHDGVSFSAWNRDPNDMYDHTVVTVHDSAYAIVFWDHDAIDESAREYFVYLMGADPDCPSEYRWAFDGSSDDIATAIHNWAE